MKSDKIQDALGEVREEYIQDAENAGKKRANWVKYGIMAACFCLAIIAVFYVFNRQPIDTVASDMGGEYIMTSESYFPNPITKLPNGAIKIGPNNVRIDPACTFTIECTDKKFLLRRGMYPVYNNGLNEKYTMTFLQTGRRPDEISLGMLLFIDGIPQKFSANGGEESYMFKTTAEVNVPLVTDLKISSLRGVTKEEGEYATIAAPLVAYVEGDYSDVLDDYPEIGDSKPDLNDDTHKFLSGQNGLIELRSFEAQEVNIIEGKFTEKSTEEIAKFIQIDQENDPEWFSEFLEKDAKLEAYYDGARFGKMDIPTGLVTLTVRGCGREGARYRVSVFLGEEPINFVKPDSQGYACAELVLSPNRFTEAEFTIDLTGKAGQKVTIVYAPCDEDSVSSYDCRVVGRPSVFIRESGPEYDKYAKDIKTSYGFRENP